MKKEYQIPDADFVYFQTEDIMTTSGGDDGTDAGFQEGDSGVE